MASKPALLVTRQSSSLSTREISELCDRLEMRAAKREQPDYPLLGDDPACADPLGDDLRLAAGTLRGMSRSFHASDVVRIEE